MTKSKVAYGQQQARELVAVALPDLCKQAINLASNDKLPLNGRAQLISALLRVGGLFENDGSIRDKEPHEMSAAELAEALADARMRAEAMVREKVAPDRTSDDDILS
ncbi:hypothetical protein Rleg2_4163 [Rhizobium leguminosarum bv. trifolii WSM2304]|uniref:Uncharacterized protein n=1 Tax=Rhizobium leguminosarum bv. trifolii (strain WSM2304) TaxID=395492 RepID=A0ABF7QT71_RHILW|nr:hypothetical protein [Rhizobium leguminosarum]ACI57425.1 hypothetical protein Rleg2_4163 [Rhizobium leguminosarum bv. trifolii WSM2304]